MISALFYVFMVRHWLIQKKLGIERLKFMAMPPKQPAFAAFAIHSESKHEKGPDPEHSQGLCLILSEISKGADSGTKRLDDSRSWVSRHGQHELAWSEGCKAIGPQSGFLRIGYESWHTWRSRRHPLWMLRLHIVGAILATCTLAEAPKQRLLAAAHTTGRLRRPHFRSTHQRGMKSASCQKCLLATQALKVYQCYRLFII